jgi:hypothetical protein
MATKKRSRPTRRPAKLPVYPGPAHPDRLPNAPPPELPAFADDEAPWPPDLDEPAWPGSSITVREMNEAGDRRERLREKALAEGWCLDCGHDLPAGALECPKCSTPF